MSASVVPSVSSAGGLLDYEAMREGLASGKIAGLALDVQVWGQREGTGLGCRRRACWRVAVAGGSVNTFCLAGHLLPGPQQQAHPEWNIRARILTWQVDEQSGVLPCSSCALLTFFLCAAPRPPCCRSTSLWTPSTGWHNTPSETPGRPRLAVQLLVGLAGRPAAACPDVVNGMPHKLQAGTAWTKSSPLRLRGSCRLPPLCPCSVYLTPHIAGVTELSYRSMAEIVAGAALRVGRGQPPERLLNAPSEPRGAAVGAAA